MFVKITRGSAYFVLGLSALSVSINASSSNTEVVEKTVPSNDTPQLDAIPSSTAAGNTTVAIRGEQANNALVPESKAVDKTIKQTQGLQKELEITSELLLKENAEIQRLNQQNVQLTQQNSQSSQQVSQLNAQLQAKNAIISRSVQEMDQLKQQNKQLQEQKQEIESSLILTPKLKKLLDAVHNKYPKIDAPL